MSHTKRTQGRGKHGHIHNGACPREYSLWKMMIQRCCNPSNADFPRYGGVGIRVCDRWLAADGFPNFLADLGRQPFAGAGLRRLNAVGNFESNNVIWDVTRSKQILTLGDRTMPLTAWAKEIGVSAATIRARLRNGWSLEETLTRKVPLRFPYGTWVRIRRRKAEQRAIAAAAISSERNESEIQFPIIDSEA